MVLRGILIRLGRPMSLSPSDFPAPDERVLSEAFLSHAAAVDLLKDSLREFGLMLHVFDHRLCTCGRETCRRATPADYALDATLGELLDAVYHEWDPAAYPAQSMADPAGAHAHALRLSLDAFAAHFDLLACSCVTPDRCEHARASQIPTREFVQYVDSAWTDLSGAMHGAPDEATLHRSTEQRQRNMRMIDQLAQRLVPGQELIVRHRAARKHAWYHEAYVLATQALAVWAPSSIYEPITASLRRLIAQMSVHTDWTAAERADFLEVVLDGYHAIVLYGIAAPAVSAALYEPFEAGFPLHSLVPDA